MINELLCVGAVFVGGCALMRVLGIRGWALPALGMLTGVCLQLTIGTVQVVTGLPTSPLPTLVATAALPMAIWVQRWRTGDNVAVSVPWAGFALLGLAGAVAGLRGANLVKWHTDSITYLMVSRMLADGTFRGDVSTHLLTKRTLGVPLLHAPASLGGEFYLRSVTGLVAAATLVTVVWYLCRGLAGAVSHRRLLVFGALAACLLLSMNRFVFSFFYLNGHLLFAAMVLLIAGSGWLLTVDAAAPPRALMALQLLAIPALVGIRPEGLMAAALALLPTWLSTRLPRRHREATMLVLGLSVLAEHLFQWWEFERRGAPVATSVLGAVAIGVAVLAAIPLLRWAPLTRRPNRLLWTVEIGLWLALAGLAALKPAILRSSLRATYLNLFHGYGIWGGAVVVLALLGVGVLVFFRAPGLVHLRFPVTTFVPLAFVLAYVRDEGAYRIGYGDSLSRMIMQYVPLAVLYIVAVVAGSGSAGGHVGLVSVGVRLGVMDGAGRVVGRTVDGDDAQRVGPGVDEVVPGALGNEDGVAGGERSLDSVEH